MIIFVNKKNEIKDVGETKDTTLTELHIDDNNNPFKNWSTAKICCYKATVIGGRVTMMTPYIDSRIIEHIEALGQQSEINASDIIATQEALCDTSVLSEEKFLDIETAICENSLDAEDKLRETEDSLVSRMLEIETALCELSDLLINKEE